jgi:filamentous hemagglutinin family protein
MTVLPANIGHASWHHKNGRTGTFRPKGRLYLVTHKDTATPNPDPRTWREPGGKTLAARLFVGFNVQGQPTWSMDDLIRVVRDVRLAQGKPTDSSFLAQKGIYTSQVSGQLEVEEGAQVILINLSGDSVEAFTDQIIELAEAIAGAFDQEVVIAEIQEGGRVIETVGAAGPILHRVAD